MASSLDMIDDYEEHGPPAEREPTSPPVSSGFGRVRYDEPIGASSLSHIEKAILHAIRGWFTPSHVHEGREWAYGGVRRIAERSGVPLSTAKRYIPKLIQSGVLLKVGISTDDGPVFGDTDALQATRVDKAAPLWAISVERLRELTGERAPSRRERTPWVHGGPTPGSTVAPPLGPRWPHPWVHGGPTPGSTVAPQGVTLETQVTEGDRGKLAPVGAVGDQPPPTVRRVEHVQPQVQQAPVQPTLPLPTVTQPTVITATPQKKPRKRLPKADGAYRSSLIAAFVRGIKSEAWPTFDLRSSADPLIAAVSAHAPADMTPADAPAWLEEAVAEYRAIGEAAAWGGREERNVKSFVAWMNKRPSLAMRQHLARVILGYETGQDKATKMPLGTFKVLQTGAELAALDAMYSRYAKPRADRLPPNPSEAAITYEKEQWIVRTSIEYREMMADRAQYERGFQPTACLQWLQGGRPAAPARNESSGPRNPHTDWGQKFSASQKEDLKKPTTDDPQKDDEDD